MNFRNLALGTSLIYIGLALIWAFVPATLLSTWGVDFSVATGLVGRRNAVLLAGLGIMLFQARLAEPSAARSAMVSGLVFANMSLACFGLGEFAAGHAGPGILSAVVGEFALGLSFLYVSKRITFSEPVHDK